MYKDRVKMLAKYQRV